MILGTGNKSITVVFSCELFHTSQPCIIWIQNYHISGSHLHLVAPFNINARFIVHWYFKKQEDWLVLKLPSICSWNGSIEQKYCFSIQNVILLFVWLNLLATCHYFMKIYVAFHRNKSQMFPSAHVTYIQLFPVSVPPTFDILFCIAGWAFFW